MDRRKVSLKTGKLLNKLHDYNISDFDYEILQTDIQKWLRDIHMIHVEVQFDSVSYGYRVFNPFKSENNFTEWKFGTSEPFSNYVSYEDALEEGLQEAIKILYNEQLEKTDIQDAIVSETVAQLAKEKGFHGSSYYYYDKYNKLQKGRESINWNDHPHSENRTAPTQSQLSKWLRDVHKIHVEIIITSLKHYEADVWYIPNTELLSGGSIKEDTYEEVLERGLKIALKSL